MRLKSKFEILDLISTLEEGFCYIRYSNTYESKNMLYECINVLNRLLNIVKELEIKNIITNILDNANYLIDVLNKNNSTNNYIDIIKSNIIELRDLIINKIDTEFEVLFLPYKVSMWDSFESIWKSVISDTKCNCSVVPIPYYEIDSDGKVKRQCYEGNYFDKNIDIIDYNKYDLEKVQPDIIYIHNPYDNYNRITMIEPKYFSNNIVNYTNMLVYVPYFIAGSYKNVEEARSIYSSPGYINSDIIIAQSYTHKDLLVEIGYSDKKIIPLGSPKIDFVLKNNKNINILTKSYSKNKVFLLTTGINDLLCYDNWLNMINNIISIFLDNKDIKLIWRPHPLTEITITTMRNNLINKFKLIEDIIKKSENIIIDNNKRLDEVISISDALISDYSSLIFQYIPTQKPILSLINTELIDIDRIYCIDYRGLYSIYNTDINEFIDIVVNNNDYMKKERIDRFRNSVINSYGNSGEKIHDYVKKELFNKLEYFNNKF